VAKQVEMETEVQVQVRVMMLAEEMKHNWPSLEINLRLRTPIPTSVFDYSRVPSSSPE